VTELGDALEAAITPAASGSRLRRKWPRRHARLIAVMAVVMVGGGAAAASLLTPSATTTLAAHGLACITPTVDSYNVPQHGETPQVACSPLIGLPANQLIACADSRAGVFVYKDNGDPNQCQSENMTPLPANYAAANAQVNTLENELERIYESADCIPPATLAREAGAALVRLGFVGWQVKLQTSGTAQVAGPCGGYPGSGRAMSDPASALDASNHTLLIVTLASRSLNALVAKAQDQLFKASGSQCYTVAGLEQETQSVLDAGAGHAVPVTFASFRAMTGEQAADGRQQFYDQGCPVVVSVGIAGDGRTVQVELWDKSAPAGSDSGVVPESAYQPAAAPTTVTTPAASTSTAG
jgi:hypothetical protein